MSRQPLRGVFAPVVTPFNADFSVNYPAFVAHCEQLVADGAGLAISGTNSEACSETFDERMALVDTVIKAGISPDRILVGTGCCAVDDAVMLTRHALKSQCAGVLVLPPYFFKNAHEDGVFAYYSQLIERVNDPALRIVLYHIPAVSGVPITLSLIDRLVAAYPQHIAGVKDSSGDWDNLQAMLQRFPQLAIFPASEVLMLKSMDLGAAGCISATNNINARDIALAYGSATEAQRLQQSLTAVRETAQKYPMVAALKHTLSMTTGDENWRTLRPPLVALENDVVTSLESDMRAVLSTLKGSA